MHYRVDNRRPLYCVSRIALRSYAFSGRYSHTFRSYVGVGTRVGKDVAGVGGPVSKEVRTSRIKDMACARFTGTPGKTYRVVSRSG